MQSSSSLNFAHNSHQFLGAFAPSKSLFHSVFFSNFPNKIPFMKLTPIHSHNPPPNHKKGNQGTIKVKGNKENVWSIDNELAKTEKQRQRDNKHKPITRKSNGRKRSKPGRILVSGAMLMEVETVLQTQEPVIKPVWSTFISSVSGIWKGVGAVFSPITAQMEPIEIGNNDENLYDCYTLSCIEAEPSLSGGHTNQIKRKVNWVTLNPYGETPRINRDASSTSERMVGASVKNYHLPKFESFNFDKSDVLEEDVMGNEPGLVFFEDGSYSRGPINIPVGEVDDTNYYINPTFKFEQCVVKGCHKRLRIVHTIEFRNGGSDIQILRVAVYEEQWICPSNLPDLSEEVEDEMKPLSQRRRTQPSELSGLWKVFEVSATPITVEEDEEGSYVYLCTETLKKRSLPPPYSDYLFGEEEARDILEQQNEVTMMWLPGGVTAYVDVQNNKDKDGILCIGVGWYSPEGINLVMERDYGPDGLLKEVRSKSELKRRYDSLPPPL